MRVLSSSSSLALVCLAAAAAATTTTATTIRTTHTHTTTTTMLDKASDVANATLAAGDKVVEEWFIEPIHSRSTYYGNYQGGGACGLDQPDGSAIPPELQGIDFTVALDKQQFEAGGCGMCIQLNGTGTGSGGNPVTGTYTVFVNNECPECEFGHLDFAMPGDGSWDITWTAVPCDVGNKKMRFVFLNSNDFFLKLSTQATRYPTKSLRLKLDNEWVTGTRSQGSYFEFRSPWGSAPYVFPMEVEVTSVFGEVLKDRIMSVEGGRSHIQYTRGANEEPTDEELDEAIPGEEPEADDDPEQPTESAPETDTDTDTQTQTHAPSRSPRVDGEAVASRQLLRGSAVQE